MQLFFPTRAQSARRSVWEDSLHGVDELFVLSNANRAQILRQVNGTNSYCYDRKSRRWRFLSTQNEPLSVSHSCHVIEVPSYLSPCRDPRFFFASLASQVDIFWWRIVTCIALMRNQVTIFLPVFVVYIHNPDTSVYDTSLLVQWVPGKNLELLDQAGKRMLWKPACS